MAIWRKQAAAENLKESGYSISLSYSSNFDQDFLVGRDRQTDGIQEQRLSEQRVGRPHVEQRTLTQQPESDLIDPGDHEQHDPVLTGATIHGRRNRRIG